MQCKATSKQTGERCKQHAKKGMDVCHYHGGATPSGIASPHYKTGRYSKAIPAKLLTRYNEAQTDPKLLELKDEVALLDARLGDMLTRAEQGDSPDLWGQLKATYKALHEAIFVEPNPVAVQASLNVLERLINRGIADWATWHEIQGTIEQRRRLVESEHKRLGQMEQFTTVNEMVTTAQVLLASVITHVTDRKILAAINADFERVLTINATAGKDS